MSFNGVRSDSAGCLTACFLLGVTLCAPRAVSAHITEIRRSAGGYVAGLVVPEAGIRAGEAVEMFIRIREAKTHGHGVPCIRFTSRIAMPSMPGMPLLTPEVRSLGYPGSYALKATLPHGGTYRIEIAFTTESAPDSVETTYLVEVADEDADSPPAHPFELKVTTEPEARAGRPSRLTISVLARDTGELVTRFDVIHERILHLIVVSDDLSTFYHEHPTQQADGRFSLAFRFPGAGIWRLFADMAPEGAGSQIATATLRVGGSAPKPAPRGFNPVPVASRHGSVVVMEPAEIMARRQEVLVFRLRDESGRDICDLEPWLGAPAHLVLIGEDGATFIHAHPEGGVAGCSAEVRIAFQTRFPRPGVYRAWMQFQRSGTLVTLPFGITVSSSVAAKSGGQRSKPLTNRQAGVLPQ